MYFSLEYEVTKKPVAVCISDLHFKPDNLELATKALLHALSKAEALNIPLVICGDLHDTKAIIRAEVANRIIEILKNTPVQVYVITGNHDRINEKSEEHGLNYLRPYATVVDTATNFELSGHFVGMIPYQSDVDTFRRHLTGLPQGTLVFAHTGVQGAHMGEYVVDKSSIDQETLKPYRIISGHYHRHQTVGSLTYIGSPFTHAFAEASDPDKGFLVVYDDGSFDRVLTNLRRHWVIETSTSDLPELDYSESPIKLTDPVWVKVTGPKSELDALDKNELGVRLLGRTDYKLDLITTDPAKVETPLVEVTEYDLMDIVIDTIDESDEYKDKLKALWKELVTA